MLSHESWALKIFEQRTVLEQKAGAEDQVSGGGRHAMNSRLAETSGVQGIGSEATVSGLESRC